LVGANHKALQRVGDLARIIHGFWKSVEKFALFTHRFQFRCNF
jgi:hypothetical protein